MTPCVAAEHAACANFRTSADFGERPERTRGAKGNRTLDLDSAIVALYQLSYSPESCLECSGQVPATRLSSGGCHGCSSQPSFHPADSR
jgi:hypothetical protein